MNMLLVAYEFPPLNSGGAHRPFKQALALKRLGMPPIILTPLAHVHPASRLDATMQGSDLDGCLIVRTPQVEPPKWKRLLANSFFNGLDQAASRSMAPMLEAAEAIRVQHDVDVVMVTAPPFSMVEVGTAIADRLEVPLILDLRDAWSQWVVAPYPTRLHYKQVLRKEHRALMRADAIIATSEQTLLDLQKLHPEVARDRFHLITNAFNGIPPELPDQLPIRAASKDRPLTIGYVGSFYYTPKLHELMFRPWWRKRPHQLLHYVPRKEDWSYRTPRYVFRAVAHLIEQRPEAKDLLRFVFVGDKPQWLVDLIREFGLEEMVELKERMSHPDSLAFQESCDLLLCTSSKVIGGRDYSISGKTFEYLQSGKPILGFVCEGAQKDILERTGTAVLCPPDDANKAARILGDMLDGHLMLSPDTEAIGKYHIDVTGKQLANLVRTLTRKTSIGQ